MVSIYVSFRMHAHTNVFNDGQERGTSCESDSTRVYVHAWLTAESGCVDVQGSTSNKHSRDVDILY